MNRVQASVCLLTEDSVGATIKVKENNTVVTADCLVEVSRKANIGNLSRT